MDFKYNKVSQILLRVAAFSTATLALVSIWTFYKQNIWYPKIKLLDVDYAKGIANLEVNGEPFRVEGNSIYGAGVNFGIKFGTTNNTQGQDSYDRLELLKNGLVRSIISKKGEVMKSFTANERTYYGDVFNGFSI